MIFDECGSGEIGRHAALRGLWEKSRGGSSPFFRTKYIFSKSFLVKTVNMRDEA